MGIVVGDTLYFSADGGGGGIEMWAYDTSNLSTWQVSDIQTGIGSSEPGRYASLLLGDTIYFDANDTKKRDCVALGKAQIDEN